MKTLFIKRHGTSELNEKGIIQGRVYDKGLSDFGINQTKIITSEIINKLPIKKIIISELLRSKETGEIINNEMNVEIIKDSLLNEFDSGIIAGIDKNILKNEFLEYYEIWMKRGDLDGIPGAEKGNTLQARVLMFLYGYLDKVEYSDLIISHAGFIRCIVNTILDNDRTEPVDIDYGKIHEIENLWQNIKTEKVVGGYSNKITLITTKNSKYIFREKKEKNKEYYDSINYIIQEINKRSDITNELYQYKLNDTKGIQICKYIEGENIFGNLDDCKENQIFIRFNELINILGDIDVNHKISLPYLKDILEEKIAKINDLQLITEGKELLSNEYLLDNNSLRIINYDIHRGNMIFTEDNVKFIDMDSMLIGELEYQIACIVISFLLEGYNNIGEILQNIDGDYSIKKINFYLKVRAYIGIIFFQEIKENTGVLDDATKKIYDKYYEIYKKT